jgi:hypothetical protein
LVYNLRYSDESWVMGSSKPGTKDWHLRLRTE